MNDPIVKPSVPAIAIDAWLLRALLLFAALAGIVTLAAWPIVKAYNAGRIDVVAAREQGYAETAALDIETALHEVLADLRVASRLPAMHAFLGDGTPEREQTLAGALQNIMEAYGRYSQIRLLNTAGREIVRVNAVDGRAVVVPHEQLQDKSDRYYFSAAAALGAGQIYLSPIDLNVENGHVDVPYQPTLRVATPVYDDAGAKRGFLVLNVRGDELLNRFHDIMKTEPLHEPMLLDRDGYWLSNGADGKEWGFMFGRRDATFGHAYPAEWEAISAGEHGVLQTEHGLFVHVSVHAPAHVLDAGPGDSGAAANVGRPYYLKIVLRIPRESLRRLAFTHLPLGQGLLAAVYALLLLLSVVTAYLSLYRRRAREIERAGAREIEDLYERAPCGYHSLDRHGTVVRMNQTELNWLGYRADEVVGRMHITELLTEDSRRKFAEIFPGFVASGGIVDAEIEFVRKDGSPLPVSVSASAIRDAAGKFVMSRTTVFDATARRHLERELMRQASTDPLTGIGNRRHFFELAEHELSRSRRAHSPLSLLLIDIDEFKSINDNCGHETGDAVLKAMATACAAELREADVFARVGGEEFAILLPATDDAQARSTAERLRERLATLAVPRADALPVHFTVSIGVASLDSADTAEGIYAMLRRADAALYQAKRTGRNRVRVIK